MTVQRGAASASASQRGDDGAAIRAVLVKFANDAAVLVAAQLPEHLVTIIRTTERLSNSIERAKP